MSRKSLSFFASLACLVSWSGAAQSFPLKNAEADRCAGANDNICTAFPYEGVSIFQGEVIDLAPVSRLSGAVTSSGLECAGSSVLHGIEISVKQKSDSPQVIFVDHSMRETWDIPQSGVEISGLLGEEILVVAAPAKNGEFVALAIQHLNTSHERLILTDACLSRGVKLDGLLTIGESLSTCPGAGGRRVPVATSLCFSPPALDGCSGNEDCPDGMVCKLGNCGLPGEFEQSPMIELDKRHPDADPSLGG